MDNYDALITARYQELESILDERQRRLYAAAEAKVLVSYQLNHLKL